VTTEECQKILVDVELLTINLQHKESIRLWLLQQWADWLGLGVVRQGSGNTCWFHTDWGNFPTRAEALEAAWKAETEP